MHKKCETIKLFVFLLYWKNFGFLFSETFFFMKNERQHRKKLIYLKLYRYVMKYINPSMRYTWKCNGKVNFY